MQAHGSVNIQCTRGQSDIRKTVRDVGITVRVLCLFPQDEEEGEEEKEGQRKKKKSRVRKKEKMCKRRKVEQEEMTKCTTTPV